MLVGTALPASAGYLEEGVTYAQDRFIVKLWPDVGDLDPQPDGNSVRVFDAYLTDLNHRWGVVKIERLFVGPPPKESPELDLPGYWRFWIAEPKNLEALLTAYAAAPLVEHVEPVGIHRVYYNPNDPSWTNQWYIRATAQDHDIDAVEGWDIERGDTTAILGITDTGVLHTHPDLQPRIWRNWPEKNGTAGVDDDGNGFVDDSIGYDFVTSAQYGDPCYPGEDCTGADNNPTDFNGHGTHVSGIAAAQTNNSTGVAGIAGGGGTETGARIMPLRMGWSADNWLWGEIGYVGMDYAAQGINYGRIKGVCAFNCSWGSSNTGGLGAAVTAAINAGIVMCVAAGNDNSTSADYLGSRNDCIDVAATNSSDVKADFSNYGSWIDVSAPGVSIYATYSNHGSATYSYLDGTSMAAPCVTGEVGLLKSRNPVWTRTQIQPAITGNVDNIYDENPSYNGQLGSGRINVNLALLSMASITVTYPNGGEAWFTGESRTLTWNSSGVTGNVNVEINRTYPGGAWESIAANTANDGSHAWTVTGTATAARVRVVSVNTPSVLDESDANFTISALSVTVLSPNGGETWYIGESRNFTWSTLGFTDNVKIELNRSYSGGVWTVLDASTPNDGSEAWTVTSPAATTCRIRVSRASDAGVNDVSDANFTIATPYITVNAPNGGEVWLSGAAQTLLWTGAGFTGNVRIELNRTFPSGVWETLFANTANDGVEPWTPTGTASAARVRIYSLSNTSIRDSSNANFVIQGAPPVLLHDPLHDIQTGTGSVCAIAYSTVLSIANVKMFYRPFGGAVFDSLNLPASGGLNEYAASLAALPAGLYEYYVRALDNGGVATLAPSGAPTALYSFDVDAVCATELAYDDGGAEWFNYTSTADDILFQWAVKFGPVPTPYVLCGARFAASRSIPNSQHTPVYVAVYLADGPGGMPGTLVHDCMTGSVGNVIGGLPLGTNWAQVILNDAFGQPLTLYNSEFYIAVSNVDLAQIEAFGRDTNGALAHRSVFYDPCEDLWFNEDDTANNDNAYPGNRLIRAQGYSLASPQVVSSRDSDYIRLNWNRTGSPAYKVYAGPTVNGPFNLMQTTPDTFFTVSRVDTAGLKLFYQVRSATE